MIENMVKSVTIWSLPRESTVESSKIKSRQEGRQRSSRSRKEISIAKRSSWNWESRNNAMNQLGRLHTEHPMWPLTRACLPIFTEKSWRWGSNINIEIRGKQDNATISKRTSDKTGSLTTESRMLRARNQNWLRYHALHAAIWDFIWN